MNEVERMNAQEFERIRASDILDRAKRTACGSPPLQRVPIVQGLEATMNNMEKVFCLLQDLHARFFGDCMPFPQSCDTTPGHGGMVATSTELSGRCLALVETFAKRIQ